jgi:hypothetical protein
MLNILKSKIIIGLAAFGALFSFLLAIFAGVTVFWLIVRIFAGAILMGSLGFGLDFFLRQALSEEDYKALLQKPAANNEPLGSAKKFDVTDEAALSPEEEYKNMYQNEALDKSAGAETKPVFDNGGYVSPPSSVDSAPAQEYPDSYKMPPQSAQQSGAKTVSQANSFQEEDLSAAPRVTTMGGNDPVQNIGNLDREIKAKQAFAANPNIDGSVKFNIGKKKVTADPKVIAKAIRTVLQRDK